MSMGEEALSLSASVTGEARSAGAGTVKSPRSSAFWPDSASLARCAIDTIVPFEASADDAPSDAVFIELIPFTRVARAECSRGNVMMRRLGLGRGKTAARSCEMALT